MNKIKALLLTLAMVGMAPATWAGPLSSTYSDLFVFGDSIVDTGNTNELFFGGAAPASEGYFEGRFTNGVNPADVVNQAIEGTNLTGSLLGGDNYSYGGARARNDADGIPDLESQVDEFLTDVGGVADAEALYLINIGGNDIRDILFGADAMSTIFDATSSIVSQILTLQGAGATELLFVGVGDVGGIPEIAPFPGGPEVGRSLSLALNASIEAAITPLGVDFYDTIGFFDGLLPVLQSNGINVTDACLDVAVADPVGAPTCNGYAFFDSVHPTTLPLQLLGDDIVASLVPVPTTLALLGLGLIGLGWTRRQQA